MAASIFMDRGFFHGSIDLALEVCFVEVVADDESGTRIGVPVGCREEELPS